MEKHRYNPSLTHAPADADQGAASPRSQDEIARQQSDLMDLVSLTLHREGPKIITDPAYAQFTPIEAIVRPDAKMTYVTFSGLGDAYNLPRREFYRTLEPRDASLVFVKDFAHQWYQKGLLGFTQNRAETTEFLAEFLSLLPRPWVFLGASSGGYASLYFGSMIGADRIHAFSPQSNVDRQTYLRFAKRLPAETGFIAKDPHNDLRTALADAPHAPEANVHYGEKHIKDKRQVQLLDDIPNITQHAYRTKRHDVARLLRENDKLENLIY